MMLIRENDGPAHLLPARMHTGVVTWITALHYLAKLITLSHGSAIILGIYHIGKISAPKHICTLILQQLI